LSDGFKLRPFGVTDGLPYGLVYTINGGKGSEDGSDDSEESVNVGEPRSLFQRLRKLPTKIIR
jgi:hypothetical protein